MTGVLRMADINQVPLVLTEQPEGRHTVTTPALPELITEGNTVDEPLAHVPDAIAAVVEIYEDLNQPLPAGFSGAIEPGRWWGRTAAINAVDNCNKAL
jgi:antitoxin HicB